MNIKKIAQLSYQIKKEKQRKVFSVLLFCIILFIFVNLLINYVIYSVRQNSFSMNPDIPENSFVMVSPLATKIERSDVVLIKSRVQKKYSLFQRFCNTFIQFFTGQQFSSIEFESQPGTKQTLRRVIGMPGDTIYMRDYVMYIRPQGEKHFLTEFEVLDKTYNVTFFAAPSGWESSLGVKGSFEQITLGADEYFVLGDNRKSCDDSRLWGIITKDQIDAKALCCYFPFKNFKIF